VQVSIYLNTKIYKMASFAEQLIPFNPYISQVPVDDYVRVGLQKQQQYNQGEAQVQAYIDNVAGLDVIKPEQKDYLNQRISSLQSQSSKIASQDFSNQQVVNSVGMLTKEIANDPVVQNAVYSTQAYRAESAKMKKAQDDGKSSASNEYVFQRDVNSWLGDGRTTSKFNAQYTPYSDYKGKMVKALNDALGHPDSTLDQMPFKRGANGQTITDDHGQPIIDYAMIERTYKGVSPERIKNIVDSTLDENDKRQISIDGQYEYRGYDKEGMKQITDSSYKQRLNWVNDSIEGLLVERGKDVNNKAHLDEVDSKIKALKDKAENYKSSYLTDINQIDNNLEGFKGDLYHQNWQAKFDEGYSYAQNSLKFVESPFFNAAQKELENRTKLLEFQSNQGFKAAQLRIDEERLGIQQEKNDIDLLKVSGSASAKLKAKMDKENKANGINLSDISVPSSGATSDLPQKTEQDWRNDISTKNNNVEVAKMQLLASKQSQQGQYVKAKYDDEGKVIGYEWNVEGKNPQEIQKMKTDANAIVQSYKDGYDKGSVDPDVKRYFDRVGANSWDVNNAAAALSGIEADADTHPNLNTDRLFKGITPLSVKSSTGTNYHYTPQDLASFNKKLEQVIKTPGKSLDTESIDIYGSPFDEEKATAAFTTAKENFLYNLVKTGGKTPGDKFILNKIDEVRDKVNVPHGNILAARDKFINNRLNGILTVNQPVRTSLNTFTGPDKQKAISLTSMLLADASKLGSNEASNFDAGDVAKMIDEKNSKGTTFTLLNEGGKQYLELANSDVLGSGKTTSIQMNDQQVNTLFPGTFTIDAWNSINKALNLSSATGDLRTTNVQRQGAQGAVPLLSQNLTRYKVKYDIEDPFKSNEYQVKLYIHDTKTGKDEEIIQNAGNLRSKSQILADLSATDDNVVQVMLDSRKK
jgi:hypothetical protein